MRKFENFTDLEVYVLSRQSIESSCEILMSDRYLDREVLAHQELLNELLHERKLRGECQL